MSTDTQPRRPADMPPPQPGDTQPGRPVPAGQSGPGCLAWGLLALAAVAFSLLTMVLAGLFGYMNGQGIVDERAVEQQRLFIDEQFTKWIPTDIASGNVTLLGARIEGLASLTPAPQELAVIVATGTQFALDRQPTATLPPTTTPTEMPTTAASASPTAAPTSAAETSTTANPTALFDVEALFQEAQQQFNAGEYDEATKTLDAIMALDPDFRPDEVEGLMFDAFYTQANTLLRSGNPATLSAGIVKANEAELYGDIGELGYERYIAGLYLNATSKEATNPPGAIEGLSQVYAQAPNYLDVRNRLYTTRVNYGNALFEAFDFCPAVVQFQAALQIQSSPDIEQKLETAQTSCASGQGPAGTPGTPGAPGTEGAATPEANTGPAPIGERSDP